MPGLPDRGIKFSLAALGEIVRSLDKMEGQLSDLLGAVSRMNDGREKNCWGMYGGAIEKFFSYTGVFVET